MVSRPPLHIPVLASEILDWLNPQPGQIIVDGTLGGGGHTRLIAERLATSSNPSGFVLALDRDPLAIAAAERNLAGLPIQVAQSNFCDLPAVLDELEIAAVDAVLLDLGLSSDQLAEAADSASNRQESWTCASIPRKESPPGSCWLTCAKMKSPI
jgi:16S rRNA (cytosine1402-N4)-methyltransferase